ncbi:hypothetical protein C9J12_21240 [Photobacterium frigidiphilum]|uniref:Uncharacterized protein n=1 Tax=Photobacterium frigidiphilum TaxID=264736 RepID=A0A2T3JA90_9GAMM|nr:hypothetical protein [Photobacterium frigidiphilum]PSU45767.1 hypothetical protein C9J12_21240 [Photobacterium frigidiphilum]
MKKQSMKRPPSANGFRQRGASIYDYLLWISLAAITLVVLLGIFQRANNWRKQVAITQAGGEIRVAAGTWAGQRNFTGVSMPELCKVTRNDLSENICGPGRDGKNMNPYGGDYTITVGSNVSQVDVGYTGIDPNFIDSVSDKLAGSSVDRCQAATGCSTITAAGSTITVTM